MQNLWKNIVVSIVSALLAIAGQQYFFDKQNEIPKIDVYKNFDNAYLSKPKFPDSKVEIKVDGNTKESIGLLEIALINFSHQSFNNIPIIIEVKPKNGEKFTYLSHFVHGEKGIRDLVKEIKPYEVDNGTHRFSYNVVSLNRTDEANLSMKLGILFEGQHEPDVVVSAAGVNTREFNIENSPARANVQRDTFLLMIAFIVGLLAFIFIIFGPIISRFTLPLDKKSDKRYAKQIFDVMRVDTYYESMSDDTLKRHVASFLYKRQLNWWNKKSFFGKWYLGMRTPQPDDYEF
ncbi:MAG: hypothetical protein ACRC5D_20400 [Aeromonas allosaccharophila]